MKQIPKQLKETPLYVLVSIETVCPAHRKPYGIVHAGGVERNADDFLESKIDNFSDPHDDYIAIAEVRIKKIVKVIKDER